MTAETALTTPAPLRTPSLLERQAAFVGATSGRNRTVRLIGRGNESEGERPWSAEVADRAYAVRLAHAGRYHTVALDFDVKARGAEVAAAHATIAADLLDHAGIHCVMACSGPAGGRHVLFTVAGEGVPAATVVKLVTRLRAMGFTSLDPSAMTNPRSGAIRPPLSPHRDQGRSVVMGDERAALRVLLGLDGRENGVSAVECLVDALAGPGDRRKGLRPADDAATASVGGTYESGSDALQAVATRAVNAGHSLSWLEQLVFNLPPDHPIALHLAKPPVGQRTHAVRRAYDKACVWVSAHPAVRGGQRLDAGVVAEWRAVDIGGLPNASGRVALALLGLAQTHGRRLVGASVREVAERAGVHRSSASRGLQWLLDHGIVEVADGGDGQRGRRYRLQSVSAWSEAARETVGLSSVLGGVSLPTVSRTAAMLLLAEDPLAEVWDRAGLGEATRKVYRALAVVTSRGGTATTADLAERLDRSPRTVRDHLRALRLAELARPDGDGRWVAEYREPVDLAFDLGVVGTMAARAAQHADERLHDAVRRAKSRLARRGVRPVERPVYDPHSVAAEHATVAGPNL